MRPDTSRDETVGRGEALDARGIAISVFFGLTIGFGTGFVGTGGGMMMLVVFTAFLHMDLKRSVGTSTFIMTFTALIASVSHMLIHPAIITERGGILVVCAATATAFSLVSARLANRVEGRVVGLVTGTVLTALGAAMIVLHYWEAISAMPLAMATLRCSGRFLAVIVPCAVALIITHVVARVPRPVFRKLLHVVAFGSSAWLVLEAESWQSASLSMLLFAVVVYPLLYVAENVIPGYEGLFVQKRPGEVKRSLVLLFVGEAAVVALGWGLASSQVVACASILMWGVGDAAAALVGIYLGSHVVTWKMADGKKT